MVGPRARSLPVSFHSAFHRAFTAGMGVGWRAYGTRHKIKETAETETDFHQRGCEDTRRALSVLPLQVPCLLSFAVLGLLWRNSFKSAAPVNRFEVGICSARFA